jgi:hypothetical protein
MTLTVQLLTPTQLLRHPKFIGTPFGYCKTYYRARSKRRYISNNSLVFVTCVTWNTKLVSGEIQGFSSVVLQFLYYFSADKFLFHSIVIDHDIIPPAMVQFMDSFTATHPHLVLLALGATSAVLQQNKRGNRTNYSSLWRFVTSCALSHFGRCRCTLSFG